MTCYQEIVCPHCGSNQIKKAGYSASGERRYRCDRLDCPTKSFMLAYRYKAYQPGMKERVVDMAINSSGIRDTARVLGISKTTVISTLKKSVWNHPGKPDLLPAGLERHLDADKHEIGKRNTQKIERKNLNLRTWIKRLSRKTICFSKDEVMHDTVIGLLINKVEFGIDIHAKIQV